MGRVKKASCCTIVEPIGRVLMVVSRPCLICSKSTLAGHIVPGLGGHGVALQLRRHNVAGGGRPRDR